MPSLAFLPSIGLPELGIILAVVLVIFGPGKLPEVGKAMGKGLKEFRNASNNIKKEFDEVVEEVEVKND